MIEAAVAYAQAGYRVFPIWSVRDGGVCACPKGTACTSPGKHPHGRLVPRGVLDASDDENTVRTWWKISPECNIGMATGGKFVVVDCDSKPTADGLSTFREYCAAQGHAVPDCGAIARTGGGGVHLFFALDEDVVRVGCRNGWLAGVDVKGEGGYVVVPPSMHASGKAYGWEIDLLDDALVALPPWLAAVLAAEVPARDPEPEIVVAPAAEPSTSAPVAVMPASSTPPPAQHSLTPADVEEITRALACIPPNCDRQTWVERVSMPLHDMFAGTEEGFAIWHAWCARAAGTTTPNGNPAYGGERECRTVWRSFRRSHRNPKGRATFFEHAARHGYRDERARFQIESAYSPDSPATTVSTNGTADYGYRPPPAQPKEGELQPWRDPEPLRRESTSARLDVGAAFPPALWWLRDYLGEIARLVQVPFELPAMLSLGLASGSYGRVFKLRLGSTDWIEYPPLWVLCAFQSGGGKSPVFRPLREPFVQWDAAVNQQEDLDRWQSQRDYAQARVASVQRDVNRGVKRADVEPPLREKMQRDLLDARRNLSIVEDAKPQSRRVLASSLTTPALVEFLQEHQERCLIVDPEGGIFQYVLGGRTDLDKDIDPWVKAYSCEPIQQNRVGDKHRARERRVQHPNLSMAICTQVSSLQMFGDQYAQGKGFLARFMPALFESVLPEVAIVHGRIPAELQERWRMKIHELLALPVPVEPIEIALDGDACEVYRDWMQRWLDEARADPDADAASVVGYNSPAGAKIRSNALRIVLLMHVLASPQPAQQPVSPEIVRCVLEAWVPYLKAQAAVTFGLVRDDPDLQIAERVLRFLARRRANEFSRSEAFLNLKSNSTHLATVDRVNSLNGALGALSDGGWIQPLGRLTARGPGVPPAAARYAVHPQLIEHVARAGIA